MLVDKIEIGQIWKRDGIKFVIIEVNNKDFFALDENLTLLKNLSFSYLEYADCISAEPINKWLSRFNREVSKREVKKKINHFDLVEKAGGLTFLAEACGVSRQTIYNWQSKGVCSDRTRTKILYILNTLKIEYNEDEV